MTGNNPRALVVVAGDDIHHDLLGAALNLQSIALSAGFVAQRAVGIQRFIEPKPISKDNDVYIVYMSGPQFGEDQQRELAALVESCVGLVAVHCSNVVPTVAGDFEDSHRTWVELLGNFYQSHGPGAHESYNRIRIVATHPITDGVEEFQLWDEHYEFTIIDRHASVLAERVREDGTTVPVLYTLDRGKGRVVYLSLGHDARSWEDPMFSKLLSQASKWAARL